MKNRKLAVAAVACSLFAACSGDPEGNNVNANNTTSGSNNTTGMTTSNNSTSTNNETTSTNNTTNTTNTNNVTPLGAAFTGLAATSDFVTSAWHVVSADGVTVEATTTSFGSGDLGVSAGQQWAYVMDRSNAQVQVLDKAADLADLGIVDVSGVASTNPQFATDTAGKAYISLYNAAEIVVATPNGTDWSVTRLDTSAFDTDGNPEASSMASDGTYAMAVLQRLDNFVGVDNSVLLLIDSADDSFVDMDAVADGVQGLDLGYTNVQAGLRRGGPGTFAFGATGDFGVNDGGVVVLEGTAPNFTVGDMIVSEAELGGDLLDFVFVDATTLYAVITLPDFSSQVLKVSGGEVTSLPYVLDPGFGGLDLVGVDDVIVGDRGTSPSLDLLHPSDDTFDVGLYTDLPPSGFVNIVCDANVGCGQ